MVLEIRVSLIGGHAQVFFVNAHFELRKYSAEAQKLGRNRIPKNVSRQKKNEGRRGKERGR
jgi:hypothetical protein